MITICFENDFQQNDPLTICSIRFIVAVVLS